MCRGAIVREHEKKAAQQKSLNWAIGWLTGPFSLPRSWFGRENQVCKHWPVGASEFG